MAVLNQNSWYSSVFCQEVLSQIPDVLTNQGACKTKIESAVKQFFSAAKEKLDGTREAAEQLHYYSNLMGRVHKLPKKMSALGLPIYFFPNGSVAFGASAKVHQNTSIGEGAFKVAYNITFYDPAKKVLEKACLTRTKKNLGIANYACNRAEQELGILFNGLDFVMGSYGGLELKKAFPKENRFISIQPRADCSVHDKIYSDPAITANEAVRAIYETALGIYQIHSKGFVHRDIKPANVLYIKNNNRYRVADFGLTVPIGKGTGACGTPFYMSTELLEAYISLGQSFATAKSLEDATSHTGLDAYALGIMAIELLLKTPQSKSSFHNKISGANIDVQWRFKKTVDWDLFLTINFPNDFFFSLDIVRKWVLPLLKSNLYQRGSVADFIQTVYENNPTDEFLFAPSFINPRQVPAVAPVQAPVLINPRQVPVVAPVQAPVLINPLQRPAVAPVQALPNVQKPIGPYSTKLLEKFGGWLNKLQSKGLISASQNDLGYILECFSNALYDGAEKQKRLKRNNQKDHEFHLYVWEAFNNANLNISYSIKNYAWACLIADYLLTKPSQGENDSQYHGLKRCEILAKIASDLDSGKDGPDKAISAIPQFLANHLNGVISEASVSLSLAIKDFLNEICNYLNDVEETSTAIVMLAAFRVNERANKPVQVNDNNNAAAIIVPPQASPAPVVAPVNNNAAAIIVPPQGSPAPVVAPVNNNAAAIIGPPQPSPAPVVAPVKSLSSQLKSIWGRFCSVWTMLYSWMLRLFGF